MDNERKTIHKSCSDELENTLCKQFGIGSKLITRCSCETDYCNGDERLNAAGLLLNDSFKQQFSLTHSIIYFVSLIFFNMLQL